ncbi:MAG: putative pyridoxal-dependent aspartate 1-decarboxylase [Gammaproteobacteria bacterium]|nr:putative pyridoxal-dependent aspartate 1-decarboxylase [Gammaproteobacteria bacterium]
MHTEKKLASASLESLYRIFTVPEAPESTLGRIDRNISRNLTAFLQEHIVAVEKDLEEIEEDFSDPHIPERPAFVSSHADFLLEKLVSQSVHTASPSFVGHMTTALPYFMLPLSKIMIALNQNLVKTETSKAFTPLERQVVGMLHQLIYQRDSDFYANWMHDSNHALGALGSGGTIANLTALWAARNNRFPADKGFEGVSREGMYGALHHYGFEGAAILASRRGHYSLGKASDVLGIGRNQLILVDTDDKNRMDPEALRRTCLRLRSRGICILSVVGIAGTTETGSVDPLDELAGLAQEFGSHFHVDAAWGGPTMFSRKYRSLMKGVQQADSVTIDAHKQLYVPLGVGMVLFKDPTMLNSIEHHAQYVIRKGSKDLGSSTLEGSRPGMAMLVYSGLKIIGRQGYELLINRGIELTAAFADMIRERDCFELITEPELNILTYRYVPSVVREALEYGDLESVEALNKGLNRITQYIQKAQRAQGRAFVSRTRLNPEIYNGEDVIVFRVVLANPLTTKEILKDILDEQETIADDVETLEVRNGLTKICETCFVERKSVL